MFLTNPDTSIQNIVSDSLHTAAQTGGHGESGGNLFTQLLHHVYDSNELDLPFIGHINLPHFAPIQFGDVTIDVSITKHVVFLWVAAIILIILAVTAAQKNSKRDVPSGFGNLMEVFILFIRDEVVQPNMGRDGIKYLPYLLTTFFFILIMNLAGLVPYGSTSTSNVSVTGALALIAFIMIQSSAIRAHGLGQYLKHLTGGVHWILWPIMVPIEVLGLFTKPFALMIRLFANMIGGHIVIISLIGLIFVFQSWFIVPIPILFVLGISLLELFVAFLQAYIFTMLTSLFMGLGMQAAHEENTHNETEH